MNDLERDLKVTLERVSADIEPAAATRAVVLRRARRRRIGNAVVAAAASVALLTGAVVGTGRALEEMQGRSNDVVGEERGDVQLPVPQGEVKIADGELEGVAWLLSAPPGDCLSLSLGGDVPNDVHRACFEGSPHAVQFTEIVLDDRVVFVAGSLADDAAAKVTEVRINYTVFDEQGTAHGKDFPLDLHRAPSDLATEQRYFVGAVPLGKDGYARIYAKGSGGLDGGSFNREIRSVDTRPDTAELTPCVGEEPEPGEQGLIDRLSQVVATEAAEAAVAAPTVSARGEGKAKGHEASERELRDAQRRIRRVRASMTASSCVVVGEPGRGAGSSSAGDHGETAKKVRP